MNKHSQSGLSMIELMIAMVIGLFLVAGVITLFSGNNQTYLYNQSQVMQAENLRLAARVISGVLPQAGHTNINTSSILGKNTVFVEDSDSASYAKHNFTGLNFSAGQVVVGNTSGTTDVEVDVYTKAASEKKSFPRDKISIRYLAGDGILTCEGLVFVEDQDYMTEAVTDYLFQQRVETLYVDDNLNLRCDATNATIETAAPAMVDRTTVTSTVILGDTNASRSEQVRVIGLEIRYGVDTDGDNSVDLYSREPANWLQVISAAVELTIQTGVRAPQTMTHVIAFQNMIAANSGV